MSCGDQLCVNLAHISLQVDLPGNKTDEKKEEKKDEMEEEGKE